MHLRLTNSPLLALIDDEDYDYIIWYYGKDSWGTSRLKVRTWRLQSNGYVMAGRTGQHLLLHRFIFERHNILPTGCIVHHVNENKLDNTINNLQMVSHSEHAKIHNNADNFGLNKSKPWARPTEGLEPTKQPTGLPPVSGTT